MEYHGSGHFTFWSKVWIDTFKFVVFIVVLTRLPYQLKDALMRLALAGLLALAAGVFYILYMVFTEGGSFTQVTGIALVWLLFASDVLVVAGDGLHDGNGQHLRCTAHHGAHGQRTRGAAEAPLDHGQQRWGAPETVHVGTHLVNVGNVSISSPIFQAVRVEEAYQDSRYELEDCEFEVNKIAGDFVVTVHEAAN